MDDMAAVEGSFVPPALFPPEKPPGFLGQIRSFENPAHAWPKSVWEGGLYRVPGPAAPVVISDPAMAAEVLLERPEDFPHGELINRLFRPVWGRGIFVTEGAEWRWQRRAAAPAFRPAHMAALVPVMRHVAEQVAAEWRAGKPVNLHNDMRRLTLQVLFDCALSGGEDFPDKAEASRQIDAFIGGVGRFNWLDFAPIPNVLRPSPEARGGKAMAYMRKHVDAMVARRRASAERRGDLVDLLFDARDPETGRAMDDGLIRDNLIGFIAAGHETSAFALSWALWLVAHHPKTELRMMAEISRVAGNEPITAEHLESLTFCKQVVQETQRLYPGSSTIVRTAAHNTTIGGHRVRKGQVILVAVYALQRRPDVWPNPHAFDPDRFAPGRDKDRPAFTYLPFGAGPRVCMGASFAMTEILAVLATLVGAARLDDDPARPLKLGSRLGALVSEGGMWMIPQARQA